jgi:hypothetical protein
MMEQLFIQSYCSVTRERVIVNGKREPVPGDDGAAYLASLYTHYGLSYPKFHKMDNLSKLAFITSELLLRDWLGRDLLVKDETGVVIETSHSSLDTDITHYESIRDDASYYPSPAVFVYTLPNIMVGEICIRNGFRGENGVFVAERFDPGKGEQWLSRLFLGGKIRACIYGWVDFSRDGFESSLFLIERVAGDRLNSSQSRSFSADALRLLLDGM